MPAKEVSWPVWLLCLGVQTKTVESLRQTLKNAVLEEGKKKELTNVIQAHFKEWLLSKYCSVTSYH